MIRLADVLGRKCAIDLSMAVLLPTLLPHFRSHLQPDMLIGGNIFFFWKPGIIVSCRCQEHEGTEL